MSLHQRIQQLEPHLQRYRAELAQCAVLPPLRQRVSLLKKHLAQHHATIQQYSTGNDS